MKSEHPHHCAHMLLLLLFGFFVCANCQTYAVQFSYNNSICSGSPYQTISYPNGQCLELGEQKFSCDSSTGLIDIYSCPPTHYACDTPCQAFLQYTLNQCYNGTMFQCLSSIPTASSSDWFEIAYSGSGCSGNVYWYAVNTHAVCIPYAPNTGKPFAAYTSICNPSANSYSVTSCYDLQCQNCSTPAGKELGCYQLEYGSLQMQCGSNIGGASSSGGTSGSTIVLILLVILLFVGLIAIGYWLTRRQKRRAQMLAQLDELNKQIPPQEGTTPSSQPATAPPIVKLDVEE